MIDLHCHILPKIDDGAQSIDESVQMAEIALKDGIEAIVATPHVFPPDHYGFKADIISGLVEKLKENKIDLTVYSGAEVHICLGLSDYIKKMPDLTINNTGKYILLEFPVMMFPDNAEDEIFNLELNGITPIICHPERNIAIQNDMNILSKLVDMGSLVQITAQSITGDLGRRAEKISEKMLKNRLVHIIASDAHSAHQRVPILSEALNRAAEILCDLKEAEKMVEDIPKRIILGESV